MKKLLGFFLMLFLFTNVANAMLYIEPFAGLATTPIDATNNEMKAAVGARAGFSTMGFVLGGEYTVINSNNRTAAFAAFKAPVIPLRVFGRYIFDTGVSGATTSTGYGVGVGFTGMPFISINLDYTKLDNKIKLIDNSGDEIMLSISVPFDFL